MFSKTNPFLLFFIFTLPALPYFAVAEPLLDNGLVGDWQYQKFDEIKETTYSMPFDEQLGHEVLAAYSEGGASGYFLEKEFNLSDTPYLHFLWRIDGITPNANEADKSGDDFVLRLYFTGRSGLKYKTLNLVYSQTAEAGQSWQSPYSSFISDIQVYPFASHQADNIGRWQITTIDLLATWQGLFGDDAEIGLVGLMTDGDNAALTLRALYGKIILSDSPHPPFTLPPQ